VRNFFPDINWDGRGIQTARDGFGSILEEVLELASASNRTNGARGVALSEYASDGPFCTTKGKIRHFKTTFKEMHY
jgi:hypothetical protein